METDPIKNIIFGNQVRNSYGNFRAMCAALVEHDQISIVMHHLRTNEKFRKYNRFTHAYRVHQTQQLFVTQDKPGQEVQQNKMLEGFEEDETLEGTGEKLLHLLQKFNVENVLMIMSIEQYNPLNRFEPSHYRIIVERSKDLLNNLYLKVVQHEEEETMAQQQNQATTKLPVRLPKPQFEMPQVAKPAKFANREDRIANRPGHFYQENPGFKVAPRKGKSIIQQQLPPITEKKKLQTLNVRLRNTAYQLEKILETLNEKEYLQFKFTVKYDQNKLVEKVLELFMMIFDVQNREQLANEFQFQQRMDSITVNDLDDKKVKKVNETLRGDKRLNAKDLGIVNPLVSKLFAFIVLLVKSYEFGKDMLRLTQNIEMELNEESSMNNGPNSNNYENQQQQQEFI